MDYPWQNPAIWHAINVHLPITLAVLGLPLLCIVAITRGRHRWLRWSTVALYAFVTVAAWFAAETGEGAMHALSPGIPKAAWDRVNFHEWMAEKVWVLAGVTTVFLLLANFPRRWARQTFTTLALIFSVTTVIWVMVTAHSGGLAVYEHGLGTIATRDVPNDPALAQADSPTRKRAGDPATTQTTTAPAPVTAVAPIAMTSAQSISYSRQIQPLLKQKCAECHAGSELKGGFDASSVASITKGGKKAGAGLIAGKPDDSPIVQYVEGKKQPQMPKGAKPLAPAEIALIRAWVASGAIDDTGATIVAAPTAAAPTDHATPTAAPVTPPATQAAVSPEWDPQVQFNPAESVAVRRFVRMKNLPAPPAPPKVDSALVFNTIDQFIVEKWPADAKAQAKAATQPATTRAATAPVAVAATKPVDRGIADDSTFVRRVFLDVLGMIPTADEARKFVEDKDEKKRAKLIDALLGRGKEYAGNWVPFWEDALCSNGQHQGGVGTHGNYRQWILDNFYDNKPYDVMVQELIDPSMPNHPPRYVLNDNHERTLQSASNTAQVFLGTAIKCASCHSHFLNDEWPQARAVAYSGFFANKDLELVRCERSSGEFVRTHFMFDLPKAPTSAPADQNERLKRVAQLITDPTNPRFAQTIVNRLWKRYMGLGLFEPVDDFRADTPPSHPELLNWLTDDFIRHGYDIKRTTKLILTSRTYQLRYDPTVEDKFDLEKPKDPRYFRSPALRRLTAEQVFDSIAVTMGQKVPEKRAYQDDKSTPLTRSLGKPAARNEVSTQRPDDTAVVQALELLNGEEWSNRIYKGELVTNSAVQPKLDQLVDDVYWASLSRAPSEKEKEAALGYLKSAPPPASTQPVEVVFLDDAIPTRATPVGAWKFVTAPDFPVYSGKTSHTEAEQGFPANVQHLFHGTKFPVSPQDVLFTYVYIDPESPPKELMIQFNYGGQWRRACWGENVMPAPFNPKTNFGPLPKAGEWVRLEFPAIKIGIDKPGVITGISYDQFVGKAVFWDKTGAMKGPPLHDPETIGDMLWALITSPEFQYVK
ncbi:MAG: hypothetical protein QOE14_471 [Humisphaera sp.]|nr:hypothetical protein [Humisphaera sp.]